MTSSKRLVDPWRFNNTEFREYVFEVHFASISAVLSLKSYAKNWAAQFSRSPKQLFLVEIVSVFWSGEGFPEKMYSQETTRPHSQKIVPISIEMSPHKKGCFLHLQTGNSNDIWSTWIDEKSGIHFREHADTSASRKCVECSARLCFVVTYKSRIREYEDRTYHFLVLSTLVWWAPILALRSW